MDNSSKEIIVDSNMSRDKILNQNPENPAPKNILDSICVLDVKYYGFDGRVHVGQIVMSRVAIPDTQKFFNLAFQLKFPIEKVIPICNPKYKWDDVISCDDNNSSGFNYRLVLGTTRLSKHASGLAFDINPRQNIYIKYDKKGNEMFRFPKDSVYDEKVMGTLVADNQLVIQMKNLGWQWGGDWTKESGRIDYQHFEKELKY